MHAPRPCVHDTDSPPMRLHTAMYHNMLFVPYFGATKKMMPSDATIVTPAYERKPGARKSFLNSAMVVTLCSSGPGGGWDGQGPFAARDKPTDHSVQ